MREALSSSYSEPTVSCRLTAPFQTAEHKAHRSLLVPDTTIQCILKHENVDTTRRFYIKAAPKVAKGAMKKLEKKIGGTAVVQHAAVN